MFYSTQIFSKKGHPLQVIWLAAHMDRQLKRQHIFDTSISVTVDTISSITRPQGSSATHEAPLALRLSGHLLLGVVRVYARKVVYLQQDAEHALTKMRDAFKAAAAAAAAAAEAPADRPAGGKRRSTGDAPAKAVVLAAEEELFGSRLRDLDLAPDLGALGMFGTQSTLGLHVPGLARMPSQTLSGLNLAFGTSNHDPYGLDDEMFEVPGPEHFAFDLDEREVARLTAVDGVSSRKHMDQAISDDHVAIEDEHAELENGTVANGKADKKAERRSSKLKMHAAAIKAADEAALAAESRDASPAPSEADQQLANGLADGEIPGGMLQQQQQATSSVQTHAYATGEKVLQAVDINMCMAQEEYHGIENGAKALPDGSAGGRDATTPAVAAPAGLGPTPPGKPLRGTVTVETATTTEDAQPQETPLKPAAAKAAVHARKVRIQDDAAGTCISSSLIRQLLADRTPLLNKQRMAIAQGLQLQLHAFAPEHTAMACAADGADGADGFGLNVPLHAMLLHARLLPPQWAPSKELAELERCCLGLPAEGPAGAPDKPVTAAPSRRKRQNPQEAAAEAPQDAAAMNVTDAQANGAAGPAAAAAAAPADLDLHAPAEVAALDDAMPDPYAYDPDLMEAQDAVDPDQRLDLDLDVPLQRFGSKGRLTSSALAEEDWDAPDSEALLQPADDGFTGRTQALLSQLQELVLQQPNGKRRRTAAQAAAPQQVSMMQHILSGTNSRKQAAHTFYDLLVLQNRGYVELEQPKPFADVAINARAKLLAAN